MAKYILTLNLKLAKDTYYNMIHILDSCILSTRLKPHKFQFLFWCSCKSQASLVLLAHLQVAFMCYNASSQFYHLWSSLKSMCLHISCITEFFDNLIVALLSHVMKVPWLCAWLSLWKKLQSHTAWQTHEATTTNLASVLKRVTMGCFFSKLEYIIRVWSPLQD